MDKSILIDSLKNAWSALAQQYVDSPDESMRNAVNLLGGVIGETERRINAYEESQRKEQESISIQEWMEWLKQA